MKIDLMSDVRTPRYFSLNTYNKLTRFWDEMNIAKELHTLTPGGSNEI
jgi:hypothetical protein